MNLQPSDGFENVTEMTYFCKKLRQDVKRNIITPVLDVARFQYIALARCSLILTAQRLYDIYIAESRDRTDVDDLLFTNVKTMFQMCVQVGRMR